MKKKLKSSGGKKVNKGAPSGLVISLIFHGVAFFVAGLFVVFTVLPPPEPVFEPPPPVERPKMKLKKPKVKIKRSSQPKPASRIVANVKMAKMPEIAIPDLIGTGEGLLGGTGGIGGDFFGKPSVGGTHLFGGGVTSGKDMQVTFYAMARGSDGGYQSMSHREYFDILRRFVDSGWKTSLLARYYHTPKKLYAKCLAIPIVSSIVGPLSFGEHDNYLANARCWAAHYRGKLVHKDGITFRFWGASDDVLVVAIDREVVLSANITWDGVDAYRIAQDFDTGRAPGSRSSTTANDGAYIIGNDRSNLSMTGSDWITLEPGEVYDFDAVAGEGPGGEFFAMLMVEIKGEEYERNDRGNPIFPLFATEPLSWETQDAILMDMPKDEANVTDIKHYFVVE